LRLPIAVDAMGGDRAPAAVVRGALKAVKETKELRVELVGSEPDIQRELDAEGKLPLGDRAWAMVGKRAVIRATPTDVSRWIVVNCFCMSHSSFDGGS